MLTRRLFLCGPLATRHQGPVWGPGGVLPAGPDGPSARTDGRLRLPQFVFQTGLLQVAEDLAVHLDNACSAAGLGGRDDLQQLLPLLAVLRQELGGA